MEIEHLQRNAVVSAQRQILAAAKGVTNAFGGGGGGSGKHKPDNVSQTSETSRISVKSVTKNKSFYGSFYEQQPQGKIVLQIDTDRELQDIVKQASPPKKGRHGKEQGKAKVGIAALTPDSSSKKKGSTPVTSPTSATADSKGSSSHHRHHHGNGAKEEKPSSLTTSHHPMASRPLPTPTPSPGFFAGLFGSGSKAPSANSSAAPSSGEKKHDSSSKKKKPPTGTDKDHKHGGDGKKKKGGHHRHGEPAHAVAMIGGAGGYPDDGSVPSIDINQFDIESRPGLDYRHHHQPHAPIPIPHHHHPHAPNQHHNHHHHGHTSPSSATPVSPPRSSGTAFPMHHQDSDGHNSKKKKGGKTTYF
jgi:hypothetical protein